MAAILRFCVKSENERGLCKKLRTDAHQNNVYGNARYETERLHFIVFIVNGYNVCELV